MTTGTRWFRTRPDSSVLGRPRLLTRVLLAVDDLEHATRAYECLLGAHADLRMPIPDFGGLELAAVGGVLLIASQRPFTAIQRATRYSMIVPHLQDAVDDAQRRGASVVEPIETIVPGARARLRFPDGALAELVEHRPRPGERPAAPPPPVASSCAPHLLARRVVRPADLPGAAAFYERTLGATAAAVPTTTGEPDVRCVGALLLVGAEPDPTGTVRAALVHARAEARAYPAAVGRTAETGRPVVPLPGGVLAELWEDDERSGAT